MNAPDAPPVRVVIADDHPIFRDGLRRLLSIEPGFSVVAEAADPVAAVEMVRQHRPDLLLLDLMMPGGGGLLALRELSKDPGTTRTIVLTAAIDRDEELAAVQLGARGIVTKETATGLLVKCMRCVMAGQYWLGQQTVGDLIGALTRTRADGRGAATLTPRELEIVAAIVDGAANREIAEQFGVSPQTVKNHLSSIFDKLGVSNRLELALYAVNHQLLARRTRPR